MQQMRAITFYFLLLLLSSISYVNAQDNVINGRLISHANNTPITNARIFIKDFDETETYSDDRGDFNLIIPSGLIISGSIRIYILPEGSNNPRSASIATRNFGKKILIPVKLGDDIEFNNNPVTNPNDPNNNGDANNNNGDANNNEDNNNDNNSNGEDSLSNVDGTNDGNNSNDSNNSDDNKESGIIGEVTDDIDNIFDAVENSNMTQREKDEYIKRKIDELQDKISNADLTDEERNKIDKEVKRLAEDPRMLRYRNEINSLKGELQKTRYYLYGAISFAFLLLIILFLLFWIARERKKQKDTLEEKNQMIALQNDTLNEQNGMLQEQNEVISSSIRNAQAIQRAILPSKQTLVDSGYIRDFSLVYEPKSVVSGDFYWFYQKGERLYISIADCTGHGVPGAFISVMGLNLLKEIVSESDDVSPAEMLEELDNNIYTQLRQGEGKNNDGMDLAVGYLERQNDGTVSFTFANAKSYVYRIHHGEAYRLFRQRRSIGGSNRKKAPKPFVNQRVVLEPGDKIYMFTDGVIDIFNPDGKRFGENRVKGLMEEGTRKTVRDQKTKMWETTENFRGEEPFRDDITIFSFEV